MKLKDYFKDEYIEDVVRAMTPKDDNLKMKTRKTIAKTIIMDMINDDIWECVQTELVEKYKLRPWHFNDPKQSQMREYK